MFFFFFFAAKYRDETSSLALEANGVSTKDAKNGLGIPHARLSDDTAPTIGSAKRAIRTMPAANLMHDSRTIASFVGGTASSSSSSPESESESESDGTEAESRRARARSGASAPRRGSIPSPPSGSTRLSPLLCERVDTTPPGSRMVEMRSSAGTSASRRSAFRVCSSTQCVIPPQNSERLMRPSPSRSNSRSQTATSASETL
mmetsp:Transcript_15023/g.64344  ORF Transcript_15023/g.64344 Transcript_15023/m.64344 type:complete len:203 (-) Transcript_15023:212-820(-)